MKMLRDNLLVKLLPKKKTSELVMPDSVKEDWYRGEVILAGPNVSTEIDIRSDEVGPKTIKVGDVAIFPPPFRGDWPRILHDGVEMIILPEKDIWAIE